MTTEIKQLPPQFKILNQQLQSGEDILIPFAVTDLLIQEAAQDGIGFLHFWETFPTVILGMKDTRVPNLSQGLDYLHQVGYTTIARNSGGLAVISEPGILNLSLIIPNSTQQPISVTKGYELMTELVKVTFPDVANQIDAKEIVDSYCPGEFDLSIDGKKFAGISQRRIGQGIAVMIYLSVTGDQDNRGKIIQQFYTETLKEDFGTNGYPAVNPESMANINDLMASSYTISELKERFIDAAASLFESHNNQLDLKTHLTEPTIQQRYQKHLDKMQARNQEILPTGGPTSDSV